MGFLDDRIYVDIFIRYRLRGAGQNSRLVFHSQAQKPSQGLQARRMPQRFCILKPCEQGRRHMPARHLLSDIEHVGKHGGPGRVSAGAASIEHLRPYLLPGNKDGIVCAIYFGQHGIARLQPWRDCDVNALRGPLG